MNPVAFSIFGIQVHWYGIIITFAMILSVSLILKEAKKQGFKEDDFLDMAIITLPVAIISARLYYVLFNLEYYKTFTQIIDIRQGGLAIHGGLIGGAVTALLVARHKGMNLIKSADLVVPYISLAQSIGRWGNYVNQEAYGRETNLPWAINIDGKMVHPTFLYESIWNIILFFVLKKIYKNKKFDGIVSGMYMILYSVGRFFIESLRTDSLMIGGLRTAQIASVCMIMLGIIIILLFKNKKMEKPYKNGI